MKKKLHTRFPATRIKKIMQTDEDVGKIAMAVPLLVSKALELFLQDLCNHTYDVTISRGAKTINCVHLKQCVLTSTVFDFLKETVGKVPDLGGSEVEDRSSAKKRKTVEDSSCNDEEDTNTTHSHEVKHTGGGRGRRGRGRGQNGGGGRTGSGLSLRFEDDLAYVSPENSMSLSNDDASREKVSTHKKVKDFDLNVGLDENGDSPTSSMERKLEGSLSWPSLGLNEMKIDHDQQASGSDEEEEEDYDEE